MSETSRGSATEPATVVAAPAGVSAAAIVTAEERLVGRLVQHAHVTQLALHTPAGVQQSLASSQTSWGGTSIVPT